MEELFAEPIDENEELVCLAYTECPLKIEDGQFVRIKNDIIKSGNIAKPASMTVDGPYAKKYYFSLFTKITRSSSKDSNGNYTYTCKTTGAWSKNSALGGAKYPGAGMDYILQATPNSFSRKNDTLTVTYNSGRKAKNGTD